MRDFGAGIFESDEMFRRVQNALADYPNVVLVLPSPDLEESLRILAERDANPPRDLSFDINRHFLTHHTYYDLAKQLRKGAVYSRTTTWVFRAAPAVSLAAVFLAFGATRGRDLNIPGRELDGVINGVDFLLNANLGYRVALGERVVVVGGGNVAIDVARTVIRYAEPEAQGLPEGAQQLLQTWGYDNAFLDAARTALRLGARQVQLVSLESRAEMPAHPDEVREAEEEGITLVPRRGPKAVVGSQGRVAALETLDVASVFDENRRFNPKFVAGSEKRIEADTIILAVGQQPDTACLAGDPEITITPRGLVAVEPRTLATTMPGVYCGGDLAFGPRIVIGAVADGKRAALAIHEALGGGAVPRARGRFRPIPLDRSGDRYDRVRRQTVPSLPVARRTGFREVEESYPREQAQAEGARCLWCNVETVFDSERCILCSACVEICPEACLALVPVARLRGSPELDAVREALGADAGAAAIVKDEDRCIRCGLCADRCPTRAITMFICRCRHW